MIRQTLVLAALLVTASPAVAQNTAAFRVQVHVGGDPQLRVPATASLSTALRAVRDVVVVERDAEYIVSMVVLPIASGGFALSVSVMNVHTEATLTNLASLWTLPETTAARLRATFTGSGALADQRVMVGPNLEALCRDVATAVDADTLARLRPAR